MESRQERLGATWTVVRYLDGLGRAIQERQEAEPDPATPTTPRFRVTGWQLFNEKGQVVRAYQPTFSSTSAYSPGSTETASLATTYDALGRPVRVDHPDGTFETTVYHPWVQTVADRNDNASHLTSSDTRYGYGVIQSAFSAHLNTPTRRYLDSLGRTVAVVEHNGGTTLHVTRQTFDLADRLLEVWDARGLSAATWTFASDFLGRRLKASHSTALGDRFLLLDAAGNPIRSRDARGIEGLRSFDALNRPLEEFSDL